MSLINVILRNNWQNLTSSDIVTNLSTSVVISEDTTLHNNVWISDNCPSEIGDGVALAEELYNAIISAGLNSFAVTYCSTGMSLAAQQTQDKLTLIAASTPTLAALCNWLKSVGRVTGTMWQTQGLEALPLESDIQAALTSITSMQYADFNVKCGITMTNGQWHIGVMIHKEDRSTGEAIEGNRIVAFTASTDSVLSDNQQLLFNSVQSAIIDYVATLT